MSWCKLHSKLLDSQVFKNEGLLKIWIYCLCRANISSCIVDIKTGRSITEVRLGAGQFLFGRNEAAKKLGMSPSTVWKRMNKLKNMGNVDIKSDSHYSVITICNWGDYQSIPNKKEHQKEQASDRQVTGKEQPSDTDKSIKSNKSNKKNGRFTPPQLTEVQEYMKEKNGTASDAERFIDFYESKGWYVGKNKMKDWRAAVRNWISRNKTTTDIPAGFPR